MTYSKTFTWRLYNNVHRVHRGHCKAELGLLAIILQKLRKNKYIVYYRIINNICKYLFIICCLFIHVVICSRAQVLDTFSNYRNISIPIAKPYYIHFLHLNV